MLVGREVVLRACDAALDAALAGRGRLLLVTGDAGIGKSAVVQAVAERAAAAGAVVRWGACWEGGALLPFGVWLDCLRRPGGDACAAAAERLERGEFGIGTDAVDAERAHARFVREVVGALHEVAAVKAQVLVLEDVHWADARSLQLLPALAGYLPTVPLLVAATYREDELPADGPLAAIGGGGERLALEGLDENSVATLMGAVLDRPPSTEDARAVHRQTGGNPLFVTEVTRLLAAGSSTTLPTGVRDVLARRLARVSASCDNVLGACSVVGTEFDASVVGEVLAVPDAAVTDALEEAASTRLVAPLATRPGGWEFVHALVRTARYEALGIAERAALHRRVVDALEGRPVPAAVLAHHAALARFDPGDPRPARFAAAAGRDALDRFAWDEAVVLWRRAAAAAPPGADGDVLRAEAWLGLGDARLRSGDADGAAEAFAAAAAIGRAGGPPDLIGRAALGFGAGFGSFEVRLLDRRQLELLDEAVTALPGDSELRPLVLARLSVALSFVGSEERRLELANEAIALSRRAGDRRALAAALAARCDVLAGPDHTAERLGAATEVVALAQRADDLPLELLGRRLRVVALLELRDLIAFDAEVAAYARAAERLSDPLYAWWVPQWRAMRAYANGNSEQTADLADEARAIGAAGGSGNAEILGAVVGVFVAVDRRDEVELDAHWNHLLSKHPELFEQAAAAAMALLVDARFGRRDRLPAQLARFGTHGLERLPRDQEWLAALAQLVVAGVTVGERSFVARCYELLRPYAGLGVFEGAAAVDHGVVDRFLALAAGHTGDAEAARRHTHAALVEAAKSGRLVLAHTRSDCACALLLTGDEDDQRIGRELAQQAATDYEALGFTALAAELSALAGSGAAEPAGSLGAALVREGDTWAFTFDGATVRVRHAKGIADLAVLLAQPGREVHVAMLEGAPGPDWRSAPQPRLDRTAVGQYRERLRDLEEDLDEADHDGDVTRAEHLATERDALVEELSSAFGLGGRARDVASDANERLRKAVSARVKASIDRLEALDPALGRHLRNSVRTGFWCSYQPERPVAWAVTANRHG